MLKPLLISFIILLETFITHPSNPFSSLCVILQEALHREQMLEQKLATLQRLLATTQEASESSWQVKTLQSCTVTWVGTNAMIQFV